MTRSLIGAAFVLALAGSAHAQENSTAALDARVRALEEQVRSLDAQVNALLAAQPKPVVTSAGSHAAGPLVLAGPTTRALSVAQVTPPTIQDQPAPQLPVYGQPGTKVFNPDIGMIGNFLGATGESRGGSESLAPLPSLTLQESEASFQAIVDPYARADFFLAIGEEGIEVEEGYVSFTHLPGALLLKAGKMRANFGRLNAFHNHTLPWIDRPVVMYNLLGGAVEDPDTGIKDAGVSISRLIPAGNLFLEATGEIYRGDSGTLFTSSQRSDLSAIGRLRSYADLSESANVEVGGSYARGHNDLGSAFVTQLYGADVTFRWRPLQRAIYRSLAARTELMWSRREDALLTQKAFGLYASLDYQFARRWFVGGRYDQSDRARDASVLDRGWSGVLTFWPSEFSQVRGQYRQIRFGDDGQVAREFLFQFLFTIGAHGAHPF